MGIRLIAEASTNHGGSLEAAIEMARIAKWAGADTVKYQCVSPDGVPEASRDYYRKVAFTEEQWVKLKRLVEYAGLKFLCTPQTDQDFQLLLRIGITEVKISSDNRRNWPLWHDVGKSGVRVIASLGMAAPQESIPALMGRRITWMTCTSEYPCPPESVRLAAKGWHIANGGAWGYSDHTVGSTAAVLAMGMGARVFEKHFRLSLTDKSDPAELWACSPGELQEYFTTLKDAWIMLGEGWNAVTDAEKKLREELNGTIPVK